MKRNFLKPAIAGILLGTLFFFAGPLILLVLLLKFIFTPFGMHRMHRPGYAFAYRGWMNGQGPVEMADRIRSMDDASFEQWKEKMNHFRQHRYRGGC